MNDTTPTTRRRFLQTTTAAGALAASTLPASTSAAADSPRRHDGPKLKLSLAAYSFNRFLKRSPASTELDELEMTLDDFVDYCGELGLEGTELTGYYVPTFESADTLPGTTVGVDEAHYLNMLKNRCFRLGLDVSGTAIGNDFCHPPGPERDRQIRMCREWIDRAAVLGAPVIRIFAGNVKQGQTDEQAIELCVAGIDECLKRAAMRGVFLALENHGGITATPDKMLRIVEGVGDSAWFGVNLDGGNFKTDDPYRDLARIAPYAVNAQIKVMMTVAGKKQPADLARVVGILEDADYRGYVVLEYEEKDDPKESIPRYLDELRKLVG